MKNLLLLILVLFAVSATNAQSSSRTKGKPQPKKPVPSQKATVKQAKYSSQQPGVIAWREQEQKIFMESCISGLSWGQDSAKRYCGCMLEKIAIIYPNAADADKLTEAKTVELAKQCMADMKMVSQWTKVERKEFMDNCVPKATENLGVEKAETYCSCVMAKAEKEFPNPLDIVNMSQELVTKWAKECMK